MLEVSLGSSNEVSLFSIASTKCSTLLGAVKIQEFFGKISITSGIPPTAVAIEGVSKLNASSKAVGMPSKSEPVSYTHLTLPTKA